MASTHLTLFLCGDVMLGRGVDQVLSRPGDPRLRESYVRDARRYVDLVEETGGPLPLPVEDAWPWGDALDILDVKAPDVRIVNLETTVTSSDDFAPGKAVHYRMSPENLGALTVARPDVCALANNHVLDFGRTGLLDTVDALTRAGIRTVGAGRDLDAARRPAVVDLAKGRRVLVAAVAAGSSGVPAGWRAGPRAPGVDRVDRLSDSAADALAGRLRALRHAGDVLVVSVHWGPNWGYEVPEEQQRFARRLVDGGVDVVHGHSSHHPKQIEIYRDRLILYGCGDFIDDYEGIADYEEFRDDLRLMYLPTLDSTGRLLELRMAVLQARRMRLVHAGAEDTRWVRDMLERLGAPHVGPVEMGPGGLLTVRPRQAAVRT